jgi:hypothetical protein
VLAAGEPRAVMRGAESGLWILDIEPRDPAAGEAEP